MKKHLKLNASYINLVIISLFMLGMFLGCSLFKSNNRKKLTARAPADVISSTPSGENIDIGYRFTVNGKNYEGVTRKYVISKMLPKAVGAKGIACYNPSNPEESEYHAPAYTCGQE